MNKRIALLAALLVGISSVGVIVPAMADNHTTQDAAEVQAMASVKLAVADAATAAEAKFGANATEVNMEVVNGMPVYEVSLTDARGVETEATVDAVTGAVTVATAVQVDDENGSGEAGEQGENGVENEAQ